MKFHVQFLFWTLIAVAAILFAGPQSERSDVKLSPDAACKIQTANLQDQVAGLQSELATVRKQLVELQSVQTRANALTAECDRAKIPVNECRYDAVQGSVFRLTAPPQKAEAK